MDRARLKALVARLLAEYRNPTPRGEEQKLSSYYSALPLGVVVHLWFFLRPDGRLLAFNLLHDDVTATFSDDLTLAYAVRLGSKRFREMETLLPSRPADAASCESCRGTGKTLTEDWDPCAECYGRGWLEGDVDRWIASVSAALMAASNDRGQPLEIETVESFLEQGNRMGLSPATLITYYGNAIKRAGADSDRRERLLEILDEAGRRRFEDEWPD